MESGMAILELADGGHLAYRESGAGRPLLMLHGWGLSGACFGAQVPALARQFRVLAPDLRGHGASSPLAEGQGFATLVDDVVELLCGLDLHDVVVVGWSMGGMLSWALTQRPEAARLARIATVDIVPRLLNDAHWRFGLRDGRDAGVFARTTARMREDWPAFTRVFVPRVLAAGDDPLRRRLRPWLIGLSEGNDGRSMARLWSSMVAQDLRDQLPRITLPCLVACGARSQLYPAEASTWVEGRIADARLVRFDHSGHAPHLEEPERFRATVTAFARETHDR
jgi:pimeloyl-[acyl-carrier protein] methyl ester esterase